MIFDHMFDAYVDGVLIAWFDSWPHARNGFLTGLVEGGSPVTLIKNKNERRYKVALGPKGKLLFYKEKA